jgi:hypothetical protein
VVKPVDRTLFGITFATLSHERGDKTVNALINNLGQAPYELLNFDLAFFFYIDLRLTCLNYLVTGLSFVLGAPSLVRPVTVRPQ